MRCVNVAHQRSQLDEANKIVLNIQSCVPLVYSLTVLITPGLRSFPTMCSAAAVHAPDLKSSVVQEHSST